jgi:ketosteroid isomerase-like protein
MKNQVHHTHSSFIVLAMIMLLISSSGIVLAGDDDVAIDKVRLDFNAAFNEGNAQAIGQLIDDHGIWLPPGKPSIAGKDNIVTRYSGIFSKVRSKFELKPGTIHPCGAWAFISGDFTRADMPKAGGAVKQVSGHYLLVLKKQSDGKWKIVRDIWNESTMLKGKP